MNRVHNGRHMGVQDKCLCYICGLAIHVIIVFSMSDSYITLRSLLLSVTDIFSAMKAEWHRPEPVDKFNAEIDAGNR